MFSEANSTTSKSSSQLLKGLKKRTKRKIVLKSRQKRSPQKLRIFRPDWIAWKQLLETLIPQQKDGTCKYALSLLGVLQSRHIVKARKGYYGPLLSVNKHALKKNYFEVDLNKIREIEKLAGEKLKASTLFHLIDLINCSVVEGGIRIITAATWELKNLMCGAFAKQTIRLSIFKLARLGLIDVRQCGRKRYGAHIYSKWRIIIRPSVALFKTAITSLKFFFLNSINLKNTFIAIPKSMPPPNNERIFNELEIENLFLLESNKNQWTSFNSYSQNDMEWYQNEQNELEKTRLEKAYKKHLTRLENEKKHTVNGLIKNFTKALTHTRHGFMQRYGIALSPDDNYTCNVPRIVEFFKQCWLPQLPKFIKSPVGAFIADLKKPKSIFWDNYLRWSDEKHETEKRMRNTEKIELPVIPKIDIEIVEPTTTFTMEAINKLCAITKESFDCMLDLTIKWPVMAQRMLDRGCAF